MDRPRFLSSSQVSDWLTDTIAVPSKTIPTPESLPGLVGYWDARDLTDGAITAWPARASDGSLGALLGTGTADSTGGVRRVDNPLLSTAISMSVSGLDNASLLSMWMIAEIDTVGGSGSEPRACAMIADSGADTLLGAEGFFWFNFLSVKMKLANNTGSYLDAGGLPDSSTATKYLWIYNRLTSSTAVLHQNNSDGTSTGITGADWGSTAKLYVGRDYADNATWRMDGKVYALGLCSQNISASDRAMLQAWAASEFGV